MARRSLTAETKTTTTAFNGGAGKTVVAARRLAPDQSPLAMPAMPLVQARLRIGAPGDRYEREADRVADRVMRMPGHGLPGVQDRNSPLANTAVSGARRPRNETVVPAVPLLHTRLQRQAEEEEEEEPVQARFLDIGPRTIQRQSEEDDDEKEEEEEPVQARFLDAGREMAQRQAEEEEEEEESLQLRASSAPAVETGAGLASRIRSLRGGGREMSPPTKNFFEARFGRDFSAVRIHTGTRATELASELKARAFTAGRDVVFGAGQFEPDSDRGKHLLAHELTHVVQQNPDRVRRKPRQSITPLAGECVQARRLPPRAEISGTVSPGSAGMSAHRQGLSRLVARSMADLNAAQRTAVRTRARGALSVAQFTALPSWQRNQRLAEAIRALHPALRHGHPRQFMIGPRNPAERINLTTLVNLANAYFLMIATNAVDASIDQVFGAANRATVKARYARAQARMNALHASNHILVDRSGYTGEVELGGLTDSSQIMIDPHSMDHPADNGSIVTLIHEAMHAGNASIGDWGYNDGSLVFRRMSSAKKLNNAAHYEVPVWRVLAPRSPEAHNSPPAYTTGLPFVPAGPGSPLSLMQRGIERARDKFEDSWSSCLDVHEMYMDLYQHPAMWVVPLAPIYRGARSGARFRNTLPYWSKVSKLTMYQRLGSISHTSADIARRPVTRIDLALSEGVGRKLSLAGNRLPRNQAAAQAFITANATPAQRTHAAGNAHRIGDLLVRLVLQRRVGRVTGGIARDLAVVNKYAWANSFSRLLRPRSPSAFPYP